MVPLHFKVNRTHYCKEKPQVQTFVRLVAQETVIKAVVEFKLFMQDILTDTRCCIMYDMAAYF